VFFSRLKPYDVNPQPAKAENLKKNLKAKPPSFASCIFFVGGMGRLDIDLGWKHAMF